MKTLFIVLGVLFVLGLCLIGSCIYMFSRLLGPPAKAADEFIAKLSTGDIRAACDSADQALRNSMTFEEFESRVKRNRLD